MSCNNIIWWKAIDGIYIDNNYKQKEAIDFHYLSELSFVQTEKLSEGGWRHSFNCKIAIFVEEHCIIPLNALVNVQMVQSFSDQYQKNVLDVLN